MSSLSSIVLGTGGVFTLKVKFSIYPIQFSPGFEVKNSFARIWQKNSYNWSVVDDGFNRGPSPSPTPPSPSMSSVSLFSLIDALLVINLNLLYDYWFEK